MGLMKKLKNRYFLILSFCFHEATLEADLGRWACDVDMVDSALERLDVALSKRGTIGLNRVPLRALRSFFLTQNRVAGPVRYLPNIVNLLS